MNKKKAFKIFDLGYPIADRPAARNAKHASPLPRDTVDKEMVSFLRSLTKRQLEIFLEDAAKIDYLEPPLIGQLNGGP